MCPLFHLWSKNFWMDRQGKSNKSLPLTAKLMCCKDTHFDLTINPFTCNFTNIEYANSVLIRYMPEEHILHKNFYY